jgi:hypothetical protein
VTTVRQVASVENHRGVRMTQFCHRSRLSQKAFGDISVTRKLRLDYFDGNSPFQAEVNRSIYGAHAAGSDLTFDAKPAGYKLRDIHV